MNIKQEIEKKRGSRKRERRKKFSRLRNIGQMDNYYISKHKVEKKKEKKKEVEPVKKESWNFKGTIKKLFNI